MSKVIYALSVSLDGFVEAPGGDLSWSYPNAELHRHLNERERATRTCLYGRRLYETMAAYWPTADQNPSASDFEIEYAQIWKPKKKIVFSRTLTEVGWNAELFKGDLAALYRDDPTAYQMLLLNIAREISRRLRRVDGVRNVHRSQKA